MSYNAVAYLPADGYPDSGFRPVRFFDVHHKKLVGKGSSVLINFLKIPVFFNWIKMFHETFFLSPVHVFRTEPHRLTGCKGIFLFPGIWEKKRPQLLAAWSIKLIILLFLLLFLRLKLFFRLECSFWLWNHELWISVSSLAETSSS